jgi:hypothetical protein
MNQDNRNEFLINSPEPTAFKAKDYKDAPLKI